ncbi:MAG: hypothetical protein IMX00_01810 [Limnochordales bacterium]|nr:hypothetical protein [Limnochordales bacterium]
MQDVAALQAKVTASVRRKPNVVGCGVGYKHTAGRPTDSISLLVLVRKKEPEGVLGQSERVEKEIGGVPTDVIEVGDVRLLGSPPAAAWQEANPSLRRVPEPERLRRVRPAPAGVSIGHYQVSAGTFGAVVRRRGRLYILSNNHILANASNGRDGKAKIGDPILQPAAYDGGVVGQDTIAFLAAFAPLYRANDVTQHSALTRGLDRLLRALFGVRVTTDRPLRNTVDAALAKPIDETVISPEIFGIGRVSGVGRPELGMKVRKSGRTTGITEGRLLAVHVEMEVGYGDSSVEFADQLLFTRMSDPGDSGSLVMSETGQGIGLLFAGSDKATLANPLDKVLQAFDATLV